MTHPLMVSLVYPEACLELGPKALEGNHERPALRQALRHGSGEPQGERIGGTHFKGDRPLVSKPGFVNSVFCFSSPISVGKHKVQFRL